MLHVGVKFFRCLAAQIRSVKIEFAFQLIYQSATRSSGLDCNVFVFKPHDVYVVRFLRHCTAAFPILSDKDFCGLMLKQLQAKEKTDDKYTFIEM